MEITKDNPKKWIIYWNIRILSVPCIIWYLVRSRHILYFSISPFSERIIHGIIGKRRGLMEMVSPDRVDFFDVAGLQDTVLDFFERNENALGIGAELSSYLEGFAGSPEIRNAFNKTYADDIHGAYYKYWVTDRIASELSGPDVLVIPDASYQTLLSPQVQTSFGIEAKNFTIAQWSTGVGKLYLSLGRIKWNLILWLFPLWILVQVGIPSRKKDPQKTFSVGFRIYKTDMSFYAPFRTIDFLIDGKNLTPGNTIFCIEDEISREYEDALRVKNYNFLSIKKILAHADIGFIREYILKSILPLWMRLSYSALRQSPSFIRVTLELVYTNVLWECFVRKYKIRHYVVYNNTIPAHVMRTAIFEKHDIRSWYYIHSVHTFDVFTPSSRKRFRQILASFLYYTDFVVWGTMSETFWRSCPNSIKKFEKLGCLWSEHVAFIHSGPASNPLLDDTRKKFEQGHGLKPQKIVGVFDTTVGHDLALNHSDMIKFLQDILRLCNDFPGVGFIYKNKWLLGSVKNPHIRELMEKVRDHPSVLFCDETYPDPAFSIAASDLVISLPFTSMTVEALCSRKRAVYYDPAGKFRDSYYDRFPRCVAHDYNELKSLVHYWLYNNTDEEFRQYLDTYIRGELDPYLDCRAITRFREKLSV